MGMIQYGTSYAFGMQIILLFVFLNKVVYV